MDVSLKIKNRLGYLVAFLLLLISYFLIFFIIKKLAQEAERVSHSYGIINNLESIKAEITDAETGVRGYAITKDIRFLKPYKTGSKNVNILYRQLLALTGDNVSYKTKLDSLGEMIEMRLQSLEAFIVMFQRGGFVLTDDMLTNRESNKILMDNIRSLVEKLKQQEQLLMDERNDKLDGFFKSTTLIAIVSLLTALVTIFYSLFKYNSEHKAKEEADTKARTYSLQLEERVNELNKANTELEELRSIEKFAATGRIARTIAHEVRNPLTNISLASEQLKDISTQNEEGDILLKMISRNVSRINQLVADLLNSTRFEHLEFTSANINTVVDAALEMARDRIELSRVNVKKDYEENMCAVRVDEEKLKLAFLNIIVNAIEAMEPGNGVLQIRTRSIANKCSVEISDNGSGMDEETLQKLFEPYFTSKVKGNGLGLTNTQNIILNHKGNITVRSKPEEGTTFVITLNFD